MKLTTPLMEKEGWAHQMELSTFPYIHRIVDQDGQVVGEGEEFVTAYAVARRYQLARRIARTERRK